ncbi:hypothetical protein DAEQUDRAFT_717980 [Daedalea quercina L-15889]|uniref:Purine-cytosine permease n=1 Tax=Daedalea quercina L-15889 TaxID=1314783 RepID=A0A165LI05_9APHY|nr:hypothetical protein DAEQUDRAFT_717980 [Daedalea quercina L-15889]
MMGSTAIEQHKRSSDSDSVPNFKLEPDPAKHEACIDVILVAGQEAVCKAAEGIATDAFTKSWLSKIAQVIADWGVETNGIVPVPSDQRTDQRLYQLFFVWFSANANILTMAAGTVGPAFYGLGIRDSCLVIVVVNIVCVRLNFAVFGPKLGTRSMVQARFSWGYYGGIIPSILNILSNQGYLILNAIIGGQTLGSISPHLNASLGIVIIGLITLGVVFSGYRVLHWYETFVWIPNVIAFVVMIAVSGKHVIAAPLSGTTPVTASSIMTFGATLAATVVSYSTITADYGVYHDHTASTIRIFVYTYLGFVVSSMPAQLLGAAFAATAVYVPSWKAGMGNGNSIGGLIAAVLEPAGGFGKFLLVPLSLTAPSQCAPAMYTVCTSFMTVARPLRHLPRYIVAVLSTIVLIPVAIVGSTRFYATFSDMLSLIGYWLAPFHAIVLVEHFVYRRNCWSAYNVLEAWDQPSHPNLSRGYAAVFTFIVAVGFIVLCMEQAWWTGPIAAAGTGDVGMLLGFVLSIPVHISARWAERRWIDRHI